MTKTAKSIEDLRYILALKLRINPDGSSARALKILPMSDTWRAMSGRHDDNADFRSSVIKHSIELAESYDLKAEE